VTDRSYEGLWRLPRLPGLRTARVRADRSPLEIAPTSRFPQPLGKRRPAWRQDAVSHSHHSPDDGEIYRTEKEELTQTDRHAKVNTIT